MKLADLGMSEMMGIEAASIRFDAYFSAPYRPLELWNTSSGDICKHLASLCQHLLIWLRAF